MSKSRFRYEGGVRAFLRHYIDCALWAECDPDTYTQYQDDYSESDLTAETQARMLADCAAFVFANRRLLRDLSPEQSGHDFWLTRNRHGAGFWDRGLGAVGAKLTENAHAYGSLDLLPTGDGELTT